MLGVAVAVAGSSQTVACIIDNHRAKDNLITTVAVDIGDSIVVETVAKPGRTALIAVPAPTLSEFVGQRIDIEGAELVACITAAAQEYRGIATIEIRSTEIVLGGTVTRIFVTPHGSILILCG